MNSTNPVELTNSHPVDIRPIKPPVEIFDPLVWLPWLAILLLVLILLSFLFLWWRKKQPARTEFPEPSLSPHERALRNLRKALALKTDSKLFCTAVSDALRIYFQEQFQLPAPEQTTEEFMESVQFSPRLHHLHKQLVAKVLSHCDLAKFAKAEIPPSERDQIYESAIRLVEETRPQTFEPEDPGEKSGK